MILRLLPFVLVTLARPRAAAAEIDYVAPADCPEKADVAAHLPKSSTARFVIERNAKGFRGTIALDDNSFVREVEGRTCVSVTNALVLVASLGGTEPEPTTQNDDTDIDERETKMLAKVADDQPAPPVQETTVDHHDAALSAGAQLFLLGNGELRLPGLGAVLDWSPSGKGRYQPSVRLGFMRTLDAKTDGGFATSLTAGTVGGCPLGIRTSSWIVLSACGDLTAGVIAVGEGDASANRRWLGATATARARLESGSWFAELDGGLFVPIAPDQFKYRNTTFNELPMVSVAAGGGFTWR